VGDILDLRDLADINDFLFDNELTLRDKEVSKRASRTLFALWKMVHESEPINFFLERDESLDKVLNIFIRVNSGGTQLSYSDLLLSIATAQWKTRDARQEITSFVDDINGIGDGFSFNKDFVLKCCLVLCDFSDIAFKVDNFNADNMDKIESQWDSITAAIRSAVVLVDSLGYHGETLTSNNAIIPIAYYLYRRRCPANYAQAQAFAEDRSKVTKWLIIALLKRIFSGQPDTVLRPVREVLRENHDSFPAEAIANRLRGISKSMAIDDDEIENLLNYQYGKPYTFSVLAFLYPSLDYRNKFHQDHIFPKSRFTPTRLAKAGIPEDQIPAYLSEVNRISNLQLLEGLQNQEKLDKPIKEWLEKACPDSESLGSFRDRHFFPDVDLGMKNFLDFASARRDLLRRRFRLLLGTSEE